MTEYLFDTNVLSVLLYGNISIPQKWSQIWNRIRNKQSHLILIAPVVSEIYYKNVPKFGEKKVKDKILWLKSLNQELPSLDYDDAIKAGAIKIRNPNNLSLVDCFILAVAGRRNSLILTTDTLIRDVAKNMKVNVSYIPFECLSKNS
ncbi:MAG: hypothetical protein CVT88_08615 [Candidatus Altiarchaeales archaeon HGW-Altiarchaeales-1]|nr:MAG: hypothetical protein CVT89_07730 [Candidatus Altiarchaeales archaeon HGW-Altiarchaeales-2]PKP57638.1 MAG: hypothetical protein CVT88_08615 [Candidatus Altiarchaeales archaeon HGW-Altiarchaeales-1]